MADEPVKRKEFEIPQEFRDHFGSFRDTKAKDKIEELCNRVEEHVVRLGISDKCTGFVTDGDLAISWRHYWTDERRAAKSVGYFRVAWKAVLDAAHRVHPSSCPGRSSGPSEVTCILLSMTWSHSSGLRSGAHSSTRVTKKGTQMKRMV